MLENLEVIIEINKWYDYETDFESEQLQRGINTYRNAETVSYTHLTLPTTPYV